LCASVFHYDLRLKLHYKLAITDRESAFAVLIRQSAALVRQSAALVNKSAVPVCTIRLSVRRIGDRDCTFGCWIFEEKFESLGVDFGVKMQYKPPVLTASSHGSAIMKITVIAFLFLFPGVICGQQPSPSPLDGLAKVEEPEPECARLPERVNVRGLRLHQSLQDAIKAVPLLKLKKESHGVVSAQLSLLPNKARPEYLKDVQVIRASFIDRKLYSVGIVYKRSTLWNDSEEFVWALTQKLGLPDPSQWRPISVGQRMFECGVEKVMAGIEDGYPVVVLFDSAGEAMVTKREKEAAYARQELIEAIKEEERAKFKP
jgi:hypothetical protein